MVKWLMKTLFVNAIFIETVFNRQMFPSSLKVAETTLIRIFFKSLQISAHFNHVLFTLAIGEIININLM